MNKQKKYIKCKEKGITLVALVVTIVVLIILASIGISILTGDSGTISQTQSAKEQAEIAEEKDILSVSATFAMEKDKFGVLTENNFREKLDDFVGEGKYELELIAENNVFKVTFTESRRKYYVDTDGNIYIELADIPVKPTTTPTSVPTPTPSPMPTPTPIDISGITVNPNSIIMQKGDNQVLEVIITPSDATNKGVSWSSSDTKIATVDDMGEVTAIEVGTSTVTVITKDGSNKSDICTVKVIPKLVSGPISFEINWNNGKAIVNIKTEAEGYILQYGIDTTDYISLPEGQKSVTLTDISHGQTIYVRNYYNDGETEYIDNEGSISVIDGDIQNASISLSGTSAYKNETITATVTHNDDKAGIDITNCKWELTTTSTYLGTEVSSYRNTFTSNGETINLYTSTEGTYYLHVLSIDNAGNKIETISEGITINKNIIGVTTSATKTTDSITVTVNTTSQRSSDMTCTLYVKPSGGSYTAQAPVTITGGTGSSTITVSGLSSYTDYTYYVQATDNSGDQASSESTIRTYCPGTGHTSSSCSGTTTTSRTCTTCSGKGTVTKTTTSTCGSCGGSGGDYQTTSSTCSSCGGSGSKTTTSSCGSCGGSGRIDRWITCQRCYGSGTQYEAGSVITCPVCSGSGQIYQTGAWCSSCGGSGSKTTTTSCSSCGGSGEKTSSRWVSCSSCGGSGSKTSSYNATCSTCSGNKVEYITTTGCTHGYSTSHNYCSTSSTCTYTGSGNHCAHGKTAQHDQ